MSTIINENTDHFTLDNEGQSLQLRYTYYFQRSRTEIVIGLLSAILSGLFFLDTAGQEKVMPWVATAICLYLFRFFFTPTTKQATETKTSSYIILTVLLMFCGFLWGIAGANTILFNGSETQKFGLLFWITCLAILVTIAYSGKLSLIMVFCLPALLIPALISYTRVMPLDPVTPTMLVIITIFLVASSALYRRSFLEAVNAKTSYELLEKRHESILEVVKKQEVELKSKLKDQKQLESDLKETHQALQSVTSRKDGLVHALKKNMTRDPLTNLPNHRRFEENIEVEWKRATRKNESISLAYFRIDNFNEWSESQSEEMGYEVLKKVGDSISSHGRRAGDFSARLNKSDFALLLLGINSQNSEKIIREIQSEINAMDLKVDDSEVPVTISAGVATLIPTRKSSLKSLFERAESAIYEAEFQGGNCVVSFHTFNELHVSKWNPNIDGELNEANFQQKLLSEGFKTRRESIPANTTFNDQSFANDTLFAVYSGVLKLVVEGEVYELKKGQHMILPANILFSADAVSGEPVILFLEIR